MSTIIKVPIQEIKQNFITDMDSILRTVKKYKPFLNGKIEIGEECVVEFEKIEEEWLFVIKFADHERSFKITQNYLISGINPIENEFWMRGGADGNGGAWLIRFSLSAFNYVQGKAYKNRKKIFCSKQYESKVHEYEPLITNQPIKIEDGIQIIFSNNTEETRDYIRHIEAWGVRGHKRHYKNGKVVFVKPYTKGKGKAKETTYEIT